MSKSIVHSLRESPGRTSSMCPFFYFKILLIKITTIVTKKETKQVTKNIMATSGILSLEIRNGMTIPLAIKNKLNATNAIKV